MAVGEWHVGGYKKAAACCPIQLVPVVERPKSHCKSQGRWTEFMVLHHTCTSVISTLAMNCWSDYQMCAQPIKRIYFVYTPWNQLAAATSSCLVATFQSVDHSMKTVSLQFVLGVLVSCVVATPVHGDAPASVTEWHTWKESFGRKYDSKAEEVARRLVWERNYLLVKEHNAKLDRTFDLSMNEYGDQTQMTREQSTFTYRRQSPVVSHQSQPHHVAPPSSVDWRKKGVVTPVRNQGQFGSAVAYAAADAVASYHALTTGQLATLSAQEVQDCCQSHFADSIFNCIHKLGGLCLEGAYRPVNGSCGSRYCTPYAKIPNGGKKVQVGSEADLAEAVAYRPVMVSIDASRATFQLYSGGVYSDTRCSSTRLDHSMLLVGYGNYRGQDYWICKNSWGANWGMEGYIWIARNQDNMCGIATDAIYPD